MTKLPAVSKAVAEKIRELENQLAPIREQRDKLHKEAQQWMEKRDDTREKIRNLHEEIASLRKQRDDINQKVKDLKIIRDQLVMDRKEKLAKVIELKQKLSSLRQNPAKPVRAIEKEIESLEWKIQTSSLTLPQEKRIIEQIAELEKQLSSYRQAQTIRKEINTLQQQMRTLRGEEKKFHNQISEMAEQGRRIHQIMTEKGADIPKLKAEAEEYHKKYITTIRQAQILNKQCIPLMAQIRALSGKAKSEERKEKTQRETMLMQELEKRALEKLKRHEKLTWEEFKILAEKGLMENAAEE
ncbi:MAG: coiled-coil protein [Candidatus Bathyarchaeia archaeon]|jgi:uncharacterized coiled-coil DUF342 family protein|nr:hypothetical protein [Candidatus Bathyarchaeota archaeon A05DMB-4]MDH7594771.1 hypothetical protein [Candidatus Bathyarchaeota archaeon]